MYKEMKYTLNQCCITFTLTLKIINFKSQNDTIAEFKERFLKLFFKKFTTKYEMMEFINHNLQSSN